MIANNSFKCKSFTYDVARDGGGIGIINTGLFLTAFEGAGFLITLFISSAFVGAGAMTGLGTVAFPNAFFVPTNLPLNPVLQWIGINAVYTAAASGEEVILTNSVAPLTDGRLTISILCIESRFTN